MFTDLLVPRGPRASGIAKKALNESPTYSLTVGLVIAYVLVAPISSSRAESLYWGTALTSITRANLQGTNATFLGGASAWAIAGDSQASKIYSTTYIGGIISRTNLDGSNGAGFTPPGFARGIAVDSDARTLYWSQADEIWSWSLDDPFVPFFRQQLITTGSSQIENLALDVLNGKMYWTDGGTITRANLDGTELQSVVTNLTNSMALALDAAAGKIYWSHSAGGDWQISRANLDGTNPEVILPQLAPGIGILPGIALDLDGGKIYYSSHDSLMWANLDGTDSETLLDDFRTAAMLGIAIVVPEPSSFALGALGLIGLVVWRRRKRC